MIIGKESEEEKEKDNKYCGHIYLRILLETKNMKGEK